ncbi:MAG: type III secretion system cytoplasmic ring protein SctQ [Rhizobacter sp.]|nr:type III secretion system cytoplasmic ring protein SctQ [Rhizobacter sp.]
MPTHPHDDVLDLSEAPSLPRADAGLVRALNTLYAAGLDRALTLRREAWQLQWRWAAVHADAPREAFRWRLGPHTGWLCLDAPLLAALVDEPRADLLPRDLRYVLLADALHPVAELLEKTLHLRFEWAPPEPGSRQGPDTAAGLHERAAGFTLTGQGVTHAGHVVFDDDATLGALLGALPVRPAAGNSAPLDWLRIPLPFVVGRSHISLREVGSVRPGDIISIEQWQAAGTALVVVAALGGPGGRRLVGLAEGSRITLQPSKETAMNRDTPAGELAGHDDDASPLPLDRLDALEVTLRFEVGELSVSLGELKGLAPGHVFDLGHALNRSPVRIVAHGNVLGKGYLVAVGDQLGVRVSEFAPSEL